MSETSEQPTPAVRCTGDGDDDDYCPMCGGDGVVMLSECGPSEWGEDCFCDVDRPIACPECRERAR